MSLAFFWVFLLLMLCGLPVMFSLLIAPSISLMLDGQDHFFTLLIGRMYKGIDNFPLMAIPFFILAGEMMNAGQITINLVRLSQALIGHVRGGLAQVNILSSMLFAGLSGSAVARHLRARLDAHPGDGEERVHPALRRRGDRRVVGHRADHSPERHHDHLRVHHERLGGPACSRRGSCPG